MAQFRHIKGRHAGQPFVPLPWQELLVVAPLFGWLSVETELRRFKHLFLGIPKKNGKSGLGSVLGLVLLAADGEPGAEVYSAAGDKKQARITFDVSSAMAEASSLSELFIVQRDNIRVAGQTSRFEVLSADAPTKHGLNVHGLLFDELHTQPNRELYDTLYKGTSAREQPLILKMTTAGHDRESICYEELEYARKVRDGVIVDPSYLPVIFEASPEDDWRAPEVWRRVNPSLGEIKRLSYMEDECRAAQAEPRKVASFKRLELNVWTSAANPWLDTESWNRCEEDAATLLERAIAAGLPATAGLDLSSTTDLTCLVVTVRLPATSDDAPSIEVVENGEGMLEEPTSRELALDFDLAVFPFFFMPEDTLIRRAQEDNVPYDVWRDRGWIRITPGSVVDDETIYRFVVDELPGMFPTLGEIGFDRWSARSLTVALTKRGIELVEVPQTYAGLSAPMKVTEALVRSGRLRHDGNPVMRWCMSNVETREDDNRNIRPVKPKRGSRKRIDGAVGLINSINRLIHTPVEEQSVYERRDPLEL